MTAIPSQQLRYASVIILGFAVDFGVTLPKKTKLDLAGEEDLDKTIARLTKEMKEAAKNLDFERAAELRDKVRELKEARIFV